MNINETSSYKKAKRLLFKQKLPEEKPFLCGASSRIRTYDLLITRELHYHCAIEAFGSLMGIEPMTTRATTWHSTN